MLTSCTSAHTYMHMNTYTETEGDGRVIGMLLMNFLLFTGAGRQDDMVKKKKQHQPWNQTVLGSNPSLSISSKLFYTGYFPELQHTGHLNKGIVLLPTEPWAVNRISLWRTEFHVGTAQTLSVSFSSCLCFLKVILTEIARTCSVCGLTMVDTRVCHTQQ